MATELDKLKEVVLKFEDTKRNAYIPFEQGMVINNSGVTIGKGLDLGQQDIASINKLKDYGLSEALAKKLREYGDLGKTFTGKKKAEVTFSPLSISEAEESELNKAIIDKYKKGFEDAYEEQIGRKITDDLTENQRIALTSASFNLGPKGLFKNKDGSDTNFKTQIINKQFSEAAKNLGTWSKDSKNENGVIEKADNLQYRRAAEAALFGNYIDYNDVDALKTSFLNERTPELNTAGESVKAPSGGFKEFQNNLTVLENGAVKATPKPSNLPPIGSGSTYSMTPQQMESQVYPPSISDAPYPEVSDRYKMELLSKPNVNSPAGVKRVQAQIGADVDGIWGKQSQDLFDMHNRQAYDNKVRPPSDTYRQEGFQRPAPRNPSLLERGVNAIVPSAQAAEMPVAPPEKQYATMEDLLIDKDLMQNPMLFNDEDAKRMWLTF